MKVGHPFIFVVTSLGGILLYKTIPNFVLWLLVCLGLSMFGSFALSMLDYLEVGEVSL